MPQHSELPQGGNGVVILCFAIDFLYKLVIKQHQIFSGQQQRAHNKHSDAQIIFHTCAGPWVSSAPIYKYLLNIY